MQLSSQISSRRLTTGYLFHFWAVWSLDKFSWRWFLHPSPYFFFFVVVECEHTSHINLIWHQRGCLSLRANWPQSSNKGSSQREREEAERKEGKKHLTLALMASGCECKGSKLIGAWVQPLNNVGRFFIHSLLQTERWKGTRVLRCHWENQLWAISFRRNI